ncbi:MAG: mechanosensitive ion channel family protein [Blautia sp.]|nr:mechanosensitive ion channel family protein [Blautia sp.]
MKKRTFGFSLLNFILFSVILLLILTADGLFILSWKKKDIQNSLNNLANAYEAVMTSQNEDWAYNDNILISCTQLGAYYLHNQPDQGYSRKTLQALADALEVNGVYVTDREGRILSCNIYADPFLFQDECFDPLFTVSRKNPVSELVFLDMDPDDEEIEITDQDESEANDESGWDEDQSEWEDDNSQSEEDAPDIFAETMAQWGSLAQNFNAAYLDPTRILVIQGDEKDFYLSMTARNNISFLLDAVGYGQKGFFISINPEGECDNFLDDVENGYFDRVTFDPSVIKKEGSKILKIKSQRYYCTFKNIKAYDIYVACVIPVTDIISDIIFVSSLPLLLVLVLIVLMRLYSELDIRNIPRKQARSNTSEQKKKYSGNLIVLLFLCIIMTSFAGVYIKTLYMYSSLASRNVPQNEALRETLKVTGQYSEYGDQLYKKAMTAYVKTSALLLSQEEDFRSRDQLRELADQIGAAHILVYDASGTVTASDANYTGLTLSSVQAAPSAEFRWLLRGEEILIQNTPDPNFLKNPYYFSGAPLTAEDGSYCGFVQLAMPLSFRDELTASASLNSILSTFCDSNQTIALAVDTQTYIVSSVTDEYNGLPAKDLGLTENELKDDFTGFFLLKDQRVLGCCCASTNYLGLIVSKIERVPFQGMKYGMLCSIPGILAEVIVFLSLISHKGASAFQKKKQLMSLLDKRKDKKTEEEDMVFFLMHVTLFAAASLIAFLEIAGGIIFQDNSIGYYIFIHPWSKGTHIFMVTRVLIYMCVVLTISYMVLYLLSLLRTLLPSRQETVLRMISSFMKYIAVLGTLLYCLTMLGVPTTSLLASAGVLTLVFSMGAQSLVADILAGLFIIFEGSFKVGDMVTVGDWHGQVVEVGIRNTTIRDLISSDVKIINNSTIKNVVNYSIYPSFASITIGVAYDTDLLELESIFEKEKAYIREKVPFIIGDPRYLGIEDFGDSSIILKFEVSCKNEFYLKTKRALRREIKLMFDRNGIQIPFPQVVVHDGDREEDFTEDTEDTEESEDENSHNI